MKSIAFTITRGFHSQPAPHQLLSVVLRTTRLYHHPIPLRLSWQKAVSTEAITNSSKQLLACRIITLRRSKAETSRIPAFLPRHLDSRHLRIRQMLHRMRTCTRTVLRKTATLRATSGLIPRLTGIIPGKATLRDKVFKRSSCRVHTDLDYKGQSNIRVSFKEKFVYVIGFSTFN